MSVNYQMFSYVLMYIILFNTPRKPCEVHMSLLFTVEEAALHWCYINLKDQDKMPIPGSLKPSIFQLY